MRIGLDTPDPQSISAGQAKKSATTETAHSAAKADNKTDSSQDRVSLSALAVQALGLPEVRANQVESLRQSVKNGQYRLDPNETADAILHNKQRIR